MHALNGPYSVHILNADDDVRPPPWVKPDRRMTWYLLVVSLSGSEQIQVEGTGYEIAEGQAYLIPPGLRTTLGSRGGNRPVWVHFEVLWTGAWDQHPDAIPYADDWERRKHLAQPSPEETWGVSLPVCVPDALQPQFHEALPRVVRRWKEGSRWNVLRAQHELAGLLLAWVGHILIQQSPEPRVTDFAPRFRSAERLARENIGGNFGVSEFAAAAGLSRSRFSVLYREHTGTPPGEYLRKLRLSRAETLLRDTELPALEVGALVGYHDPSVFGRLFRKHCGMTPTEWRAAHRNS